MWGCDIQIVVIVSVSKKKIGKKKRIIETETEKKMIEVLFRKCERLEVNKYLVV